MVQCRLSSRCLRPALLDAMSRATLDQVKRYGMLDCMRNRPVKAETLALISSVPVSSAETAVRQRLTGEFQRDIDLGWIDRTLRFNKVILFRLLFHGVRDGDKGK